MPIVRDSSGRFVTVDESGQPVGLPTRDVQTGRLQSGLSSNTLPAREFATQPEEEQPGLLRRGASFAGGVAKEVVLAPLRALAAPAAQGSEALISLVTGQSPKSNALSRFAFRGTEPSRFARIGGDPNDPRNQAYRSDARTFAIGENILDAASLIPASHVASSFAKEGIKGLGKEVLRQAPREILLGAGYGLTSSGREQLPAEQVLRNTALGGLFGGALAITTPLVTGAISRSLARRAAEGGESSLVRRLLRGSSEVSPELAEQMARARRIASEEIGDAAESSLLSRVDEAVALQRFEPISLPEQVADAISRQSDDAGRVVTALRQGRFGALRQMPEVALENVLESVELTSPSLAKTIRKEVADGIVAAERSRRELTQAFGQVSTPEKVVNEAKTKFVDQFAPVEDTLRRAEERGGFSVLPEADISRQFDRVLRAPSIANQFIRDEGLETAIQAAEKRGVLNELDQYLIAKQAEDIRVNRPDVELNRPAAQDRLIIQQFEAQVGDIAKQVNQFSQRLLDRAVEGGLIGRQLAAQLKQMFPNYVPVNRVFAAVEEAGPGIARGGNLASVAQQKVVQSLKGSQRAIENPMISLTERAHDVILQVEKNRAAQMMASYRQLPGNPFGIRSIATGTKAAPGKGKFSAIIDGVVQQFEVEKEFADVIAAATPQQIGLIGRILAIPVRVAKVGITGLNLPFTATNVLRDQITGVFNSKRAWNTAANPLVFGRALFSALRHDDLYREAVREGVVTTSFDLLRNQARESVESIASRASAASRVKYAIKNPGQFIKETGRGVENLIGRSEELRRLQEYIGTKEALLKQGMTSDRAKIEAADAARWVTANFFRRGEYGAALNGAFLYLNAGIQGNRSFLRAFSNSPAKVTAKVVASLFMPVATIAAWNLKDDARRAAYEDIPEWEKDNSLIILPPNPQKDENGRWNAYKIPLPPNLASLAAPVRRSLEAARGLDPVRFRDIAEGVLGTVSPIAPDFENRRRFTSSMLSTLTPQAIRPSIEAFSNRVFFTDTPIVPQNMQNLPPALQVKDNTSGTARVIGGALDASPIQVEQFIKGTFGGVGSQALNLSDQIAASLGIIPAEQIGGESIKTNITRRLLRATGGELARQDFEKIQALRQDSDAASYTLKREAIEAVNQLEGMPKQQQTRQLIGLRRTDPDLYERIVDEQKDRKLGLSDQERLVKSLGVKDETRARFIFEAMQTMTPEQRRQYEINLRRKKILTKEVALQLRKLQRGDGTISDPRQPVSAVRLPTR